jgi:hypothetical protein
MVGSLMRSLIGSITGFAGTEAVGLTRPAQFDLALATYAEFIICNQSIEEVFLTINGERHYLVVISFFAIAHSDSNWVARHLGRG